MRRALLLLLGSPVLFAFAACGGAGAGEPCGSDTDCKGDRICDVSGRCVDPNGAGGGWTGTGTGTGTTSGGGVSPQDLCAKIASLGCPGTPYGYEACVGQYQAAAAACPDQIATLQSYIDCAETYVRCDTTTGEGGIWAPECMGTALAISWCFAGSGSSSSGATSSGYPYDGGYGGGGYGGYDGGYGGYGGGGYGGYDAGGYGGYGGYGGGGYDAGW